ncbi:MAG: NTP transferase domain-containing protein [Deinococcota bacterium]
MPSQLMHDDHHNTCGVEHSAQQLPQPQTPVQIPVQQRKLALAARAHTRHARNGKPDTSLAAKVPRLMSSSEARQKTQEHAVARANAGDGQPLAAKGYSGAVLATDSILRRSSHLPLDDYLGSSLISYALKGLDNAYEKFVIADVLSDAELDVPRYPELTPSGRELGGLHSALSFAFQDWVAVVAYDLPYVSRYYWDYLFARRGGAPIVIAQNAKGDFEPLAALYHRSVIMQAAHLLEQGQGDIEELISVCGATVVAWESLEVRFGRQLFNTAVPVSKGSL